MFSLRTPAVAVATGRATSASLHKFVATYKSVDAEFGRVGSDNQVPEPQDTVSCVVTGRTAPHQHSARQLSISLPQNYAAQVSAVSEQAVLSDAVLGTCWWDKRLELRREYAVPISLHTLERKFDHRAFPCFLESLFE